MDDERLEQMMRDGLAERAGDVEPRPEYAGAAHTAARRRRALKVGAAGLVVAAVIVPLVMVASGGDDPERRTDVADRTPGTTSSVEPGSGPDAVPSSWRVESYRGIQLRVPPDWGWGGAPHDESYMSDEYICGDGAFDWPGKDNSGPEYLERSYVGRADYGMTDLCQNILPPTFAKVWLGTSFEVGSSEAGNGFVQETIEVAGIRVTAVDDDADRRATVLGSVEAVSVDANGCDATSVSAVVPENTMPVRKVQSLAVCVYRLPEHGHDGWLGYSTEVRGAAAAEFAQAVMDGAPATEDDCNWVPARDEVEYEWVVLHIRGAESAQDVVAHVRACPPGYDYGAGVRAFSRDDVRLWAVEGITVYVSGGQVGNALSEFFHPGSG